MLNDLDHESLDMGGRRVSNTKPLDMSRLSGRTRFAQRRFVRNGQLYAAGDTVWLPSSVQSTGSYPPTDDKILNNVTCAASILVGSLVQGAGVGREAYVQAVDRSAKKITLSQPRYGAAGIQKYNLHPI